MPTSRKRLAAAIMVAAGVFPPIADALIINNGYSPAIDDRFVSGYASAPVANTSPQFLTAGMDLSGAGWNLADATQSAGLLSSRTLLEAIHYPMPTNGSGVTTFTLGFVAPGSSTVI